MVTCRYSIRSENVLPTSGVYTYLAMLAAMPAFQGEAQLMLTFWETQIWNSLNPILYTTRKLK